LENDVVFLIQRLEEEQASLRHLIDTAVKCGEYLIAHYHSEAMEHVNRQLQTLRNLDDKRFDEKRGIKRLIQGSEKQLQSDLHENIKLYLEKEILKYKQELEKLDSLEKVSVAESNILAHHLDLLINNKIKKVKIVLRRDYDHFIEIKKYKAGVKIVLPHLKTLLKNYSIQDDNLSKFLGLGFKITNQENKLTLILNRHKAEMVDELKRILSIIVFEIYYFREFEGGTFLEIDA
jgi:hypothetical protein